MNLSTYFETHGRGSATKLAEAINAFSSDVSSWATGNRQVPAERCPEIEEATGGMVRCEELRPDVNWAVLRKAKPRVAKQLSEKVA